jgi:hypothetical protein
MFNLVSFLGFLTKLQGNGQKRNRSEACSYRAQRGRSHLALDAERLRVWVGSAKTCSLRAMILLELVCIRVGVVAGLVEVVNAITV